MTDADVLPYVRERLPGFVPAGAPTRLPGGNLNVVWRVPGRDRSVIVKFAPPYIAVDPEIPLDPFRLTIEARCLEALGGEGRLSDVSRPGIRPPRLIDAGTEPHVLIMEDCGAEPTLGRWLREGEDETVGQAARIGRRLGAFLGRLHGITDHDAHCATWFDNQPMQETRLNVQYRSVTDMLRTAGVKDASGLGKTAEALGSRLLTPGCCLTMGDLWPPSVLVAGGALRIIDWELAHYGRPLQDVAHWGAHLWMHRHRAPSHAVRDAVDRLRTAFWDGYREVLDATGCQLWDEGEHRDAAVHFGAEILVRAVGPFQDGALYHGLPPDHPVVQEAVQTATRALRDPTAVKLFSGSP